MKFLSSAVTLLLSSVSVGARPRFLRQRVSHSLPTDDLRPIRQLQSLGHEQPSEQTTLPQGRALQGVLFSVTANEETAVWTASLAPTVSPPPSGIGHGNAEGGTLPANLVNIVQIQTPTQNGPQEQGAISPTVPVEQPVPTSAPTAMPQPVDTVPGENPTEDVPAPKFAMSNDVPGASSTVIIMDYTPDDATPTSPVDAATGGDQTDTVAVPSTTSQNSYSTTSTSTGMVAPMTESYSATTTETTTTEPVGPTGSTSDSANSTPLTNGVPVPDPDVSNDTLGASPADITTDYTPNDAPPTSPVGPATGGDQTGTTTLPSTTSQNSYSTASTSTGMLAPETPAAPVTEPYSATTTETTTPVDTVPNDNPTGNMRDAPNSTPVTNDVPVPDPNMSNDTQGASPTDITTDYTPDDAPPTSPGGPTPGGDQTGSQNSYSSTSSSSGMIRGTN